MYKIFFNVRCFLWSIAAEIEYKEGIKEEKQLKKTMKKDKKAEKKRSRKAKRI